MCHYSGVYGHGGQDPVGVVNILQTPDVFMTVTLPGVTSAHVGRTSQVYDAIKIPPIAVHVVQWMADMKVQWRVIDMDGSVFDGLDPVYFFLKHHRLRHRHDQGNFGFGVPRPIEGPSANVFGSGPIGRAADGQSAFVIAVDKEERLAQIGHVSPPPSKMPKTSKKAVSPKKLTKKLVNKDVIKPKPVRKNEVVTGSGGDLKKSITVQPEVKPEVMAKNPITAPPIKEFEIIVERCGCMDSLGYLPFGCFCNKSDETKSSPQKSSTKTADQIEDKDVLEVHAPDDDELMNGQGSSKSESIPSNTLLDQKSYPSNALLDQKSSAKGIIKYHIYFSKRKTKI